MFGIAEGADHGAEATALSPEIDAADHDLLATENAGEPALHRLKRGLGIGLGRGARTPAAQSAAAGSSRRQKPRRSAAAARRVEAVRKWGAEWPGAFGAQAEAARCSRAGNDPVLRGRGRYDG